MKDDIFGVPTGPPIHIRLECVTLRVRDRFLLAGTNWEILPGESWVVVGPNGAGKTSLVGALDGTVPVVRGRIHRNWRPALENPVGYVSFEQQRRFAAREDLDREARFFSGRIHEEITAGDILADAADMPGCDASGIADAAGWMGIENLLQTGAGRLSNGEMRKLMIARSLLGRPRLLVLDEPFDGLDDTSRRDLKRRIRQMHAAGMQIVLVTHRLEDVPPGFSRCMEVRGDRVRELPWITPEAASEPEVERRVEIRTAAASEIHADAPGRADAVVDFRDVTVRYGDFVVLGCLDWLFRRGENWALTGPNGSGKTTLLRLITADVEQAYSNEIYLFGRRRGAGETIWDIKRDIGMVGTELQLLYRRSISVLDVVVSGFYDSVGLYRSPQPDELEAARERLKEMGLIHLADRLFDRLSFGEQRLVLMARAVVKSPRLLILDEPCQGMDPENRRRVLELADSIGASENIHLLFVTHYESEIPESINRELRIDKPVDGRTPVKLFHR